MAKINASIVFVMALIISPLICLSSSSISQSELSKSKEEYFSDDDIDPGYFYSLVDCAKRGTLSLLYPLLNPSLTMPFLFGSQIYPSIPHVNADSVFGHVDFGSDQAKDFSTAAKSTQNGVATFWLGPLFCIYVVNNDARNELVRESHIGVVDQAAAEHLRWITGGNNVMANFPDLMPIENETYKKQRKFLLTHFNARACDRLLTVNYVTPSFLHEFCDEVAGQSISLRDFVIKMVLHMSSHFLGIHQYPLDRDYFEDQEYREILGKVAHYGISETADPKFEDQIYDMFKVIVLANFDEIEGSDPQTNFMGSP